MKVVILRKNTLIFENKIVYFDTEILHQNIFYDRTHLTTYFGTWVICGSSDTLCSLNRIKEGSCKQLNSNPPLIRVSDSVSTVKLKDTEAGMWPGKLLM